MKSLVLSLFPGIGMLDRAFEEAGFCVVRGPDLLWGSDIRRFHPPTDIFQGIIGGDPCQSHSSLANLVRAKRLEPRFPDLTAEFKRVIEEAKPKWFLRENVRNAPSIEPSGYNVTSFLLDNCWLGEAQMRKRRFWFGMLGAKAPNLRRWIPGVALELPEQAQSVNSDTRAVPVRYGGSGKVKMTAVSREDAPQTRVERGPTRWTKQAPVTGRHDGADGSVSKDYSPPRRTLAEMLELQGFEANWLNHSPFKMQAKREMVGNGVPLPMGTAIAQAIKKALASTAMALLFLGVGATIGCAPSRFGQLQAAALNDIVVAPAAATHRDGSFDGLAARIIFYPVVAPARMGVGGLQFIVNPGCELFAPGKCSPWMPATPYTIVVESWRLEN